MCQAIRVLGEVLEWAESELNRFNVRRHLSCFVFPLLQRLIIALQPDNPVAIYTFSPARGVTGRLYLDHESANHDTSLFTTTIARRP
jgi:hypothetical protein